MPKIVRIYADVVVDLFHRGHVEFFKKIKSLYKTTYVIIGVQSDEDSARYKRIPVFNAEDRAEIVKSCKYVDEVVFEPPLYITEKFIKKHNIDIVAHGDDMTEYLKKYNYEIPMKLGIMKTVPYYNDISTTEIIKRILATPNLLNKI